MASARSPALVSATKIAKSPRMRRAGFVFVGGALALSLIAACGSDRDGYSTATNGVDPGVGFGGDDDNNGNNGDFGDNNDPDNTQDPVDCESARNSRSALTTRRSVWNWFSTGAANTRFLV